MIGRIFILIAVCSLVYSCGVLKSGSSKAENFDRFYERFHADSLFQLSRITFPLEGLPSFADENQFAEEFKWEADSWELHKPINYKEFPDLKRELEREDSLIKESVNMGNGFALERHFALKGNQWYLVLYVGINRVR